MRRNCCFTWFAITIVIGVMTTSSCNPGPADTKGINSMSSVDQEIRDKNIAIIKEFFETMRLKRMNDWTNLWEEEGFIYVPYPVLNFPDTIQTKKAISEGFHKLFAEFKAFNYSIQAIYPSIDPAIVVVEYNVSAILLKTNAVYNGKNIAVFKFKNEKILAYHDYFNPEKFKIVAETLSQAQLKQ